MAIRTSNKGSSRRGSSQGLIKVIIFSISVLAAAVILRSREQVRETEPQKPVVVAEFDTVNIAVPAAPVATGTKLKDVRFTTMAFPRHQVPPGAITDISLVLDAVAAAPLPASFPIFQSNLARADSLTNPVIEQIPSGMRAMTINVDATSSVEGWAGSGALVDVLLVEKDRTSVIAEKVRILSAERSVTPIEGSNTPTVPSTVTILVTQEQCLAINTAIPLGRIAFALRSTTDDERWLDTRFTAERLKGGTVIKDNKGTITGYASVGKGSSFALSDGKWVPTDVIPSGFLPSKERG